MVKRILHSSLAHSALLSLLFFNVVEKGCPSCRLRSKKGCPCCPCCRYYPPLRGSQFTYSFALARYEKLKTTGTTRTTFILPKTMVKRILHSLHSSLFTPAILHSSFSSLAHSAPRRSALHPLYVYPSDIVRVSYGYCTGTTRRNA